MSADTLDNIFLTLQTVCDASYGRKLDGGLAILAECIQKICSLPTQRTTFKQLGHPEQSSAFQV
ncbi:hypothetical protein PC121_g4900 [Phytophthora cactorum]|nr:hypothetical protein PC120_g3764 [Phytophthora cactorum]KAG3086449.1 hypothetical protein PC121_g4900 [Phytophthora cactorum]